ncbi:MAG TPA: SDR family NAD(P)-dependent oxidoreductase [bacterium]|jgi:NAD(P)-dependent dehydrogenase (short-subunit alcohol dehydrogenase family)
MRLQGRTALITGAGGPMGRAIAERFAAEGAGLALVDVSARRLDAAKAFVRSKLTQDAGLFAQRCDVTDGPAVAALVEAAQGALGPLHVLINVVGGIRGTINQPLQEIDEARWDATFQLNLKGTYLLTRALAPGMRDAGWGRIVNIASVDMAGAPGRADYGAAKAAVASLTRSLAAEYAPIIAVNCIAPGIIRTSAVERLPAETVEGFRQRALLGRLGEPSEIASAALFLASDEASYITGEILAVSGGISARL